MSDKLPVQDALTELLKENKNLLKNGQALTDALFERADMSFVDRKIYEKAFVDANIGEIFLIETMETANEQAFSKLNRIMQEGRALDVLETLTNALNSLKKVEPPPPPPEPNEGIIKKFFSTKGRLNRKRYFLRGLAVSAFAVVAVALILFADLALQRGGGLYTFLIFFALGMSLVAMVSSVTLMIRRLHDLDKSGWWVLALLASNILLGIKPEFNILLIVIVPAYCYLLFKIGTIGTNQYGVDPLRHESPY